MSYPILVERFDDKHPADLAVCEGCGKTGKWDPTEGDPYDLCAKCESCGEQVVFKYMEADKCGGCGELGFHAAELGGCCSRACMLQAEYAAALTVNAVTEKPTLLWCSRCQKWGDHTAKSCPTLPAPTLFIQALAAVLAIAAMLVPAPAMAAPPTDRPAHNTTIVDSLAIGRAYFNVPDACPDGVHFYYAALPPRVEAATYLNTCTIWLTEAWLRRPRNHYTRVQRCIYIVHEVGHALAGLGHSPDRRSVMYPGPTFADGCVERFARRSLTVSGATRRA